MTENPGIHVLTDARWAELEPLIDEVRPPCKVPHDNLRETIEAILWRHQNGAKWRSIPGELGPWWKAAQTFIRWAHLGVWERLLNLVQQRGVALGMAFLDGTNIRAHQKAAGADKRGADSEQRDRREALGRSRGGYGTKACVDGWSATAALPPTPSATGSGTSAPDRPSRQSAPMRRSPARPGSTPTGTWSRTSGRN
jgi:transposase